MHTKKDSSAKLTTLIFIFPLVVLLLYGILSHLFFFYTQKDTISEVQQYKQTLIDIEKNRLKEKIDNFSQFIQYYDSKSSDKIKKDAKSIVSLAVNIANNIYRNYEEILPEDKLKQNQAQTYILNHPQT